MKHAGSVVLDQLEPLLQRIRAMPGLKENTRGVFYWKSQRSCISMKTHMEFSPTCAMQAGATLIASTSHDKPTMPV